MRASLASLHVGSGNDCDHPGLAWERLYHPADVAGNQDKDRAQHVRHLANLVVPRPRRRAGFDYAGAVERYARLLTSMPDTRLFVATTTAPLAIGLGNPSPTEIGIYLHHTYGVPCLPGEALKGVAATMAWRRGVRPDEGKYQQVYRTLFGAAGRPPEGAAPISGDEAAYARVIGADGDPVSAQGYVTFWPAMLMGGQSKPLHVDTITPHHPQYHRTKGTTPATDFDDPIPLAFLSVKPGMRFLLALSAPGAPAWVDTAAELLQAGLAELGVGAKTSSGYGRMSLVERRTEDARPDVR